MSLSKRNYSAGRAIAGPLEFAESEKTLMPWTGKGNRAGWRESRSIANSVQHLNRIHRKVQFGGGEILPEMRDRRCAGYQQDIECPVK